MLYVWIFSYLFLPGENLKEIAKFENSAHVWIERVPKREQKINFPAMISEVDDNNVTEWKRVEASNRNNLCGSVQQHFHIRLFHPAGHPIHFLLFQCLRKALLELFRNSNELMLVVDYFNAEKKRQTQTNDASDYVHVLSKIGLSTRCCQGTKYRLARNTPNQTSEAHVKHWTTREISSVLLIFR